MDRKKLENWCDELEGSPRTIGTDELVSFLRAGGFEVRRGTNHGWVAVYGKNVTMTIPFNRKELGVHYVKRAVRLLREVLGDELDADRRDDEQIRR